MIDEKRVLGLLGIATKAGKLIAGADVVEENIKKNSLSLVILAEDSSDKTKKNFKFFCDKYHIDLCIFSTKEKISSSIGKTNKAILGLKDINISKEIKKMIYGGDAIE